MIEFYAPYANFLGHVGVLCFLVAYLLLQKNKLTYDSVRYLGLNLLGAVLVMLSLLVEWNAPAFVLEACWALISIYGIYRSLRRRLQTPDR
jgi:membrane-bound ClpP family serine protease